MSTGVGGILAKGRAVALAAVATVAAVGAAEACPNYGSSPSFGTITLYNGFLPDPYVRNITAGGGYNLGSCGFNWSIIIRKPSFSNGSLSGEFIEPDTSSRKTRLAGGVLSSETFLP
jgi:hypothetical protein